MFDAGVRAAAVPDLRGALGTPGSGRLRIGAWELPTGGLRRVLLIAAGKAARPLAQSTIAALRDVIPGDCRIEGNVLVPESAPAGSTASAMTHPRVDVETIEVRPADANAPTSRAVAETERLLALARGARDDTLVVCALTGGGSATLCAPAPGLTLRDKQHAVELVTADGATIDEINTLRRHLSAVKGGRLAQAAAGARAAVSLLLSDVDGDRPHVIASGPAVPDSTTYREALALREEWPAAVLAHLEAGCRGAILETPETLPPNVAWAVLRTPDDALRGAAARAVALGWRVESLPRPTPSPLTACVEAHMAAIRRATDDTAILSVGETPLELPPIPPDGGRAGHLSLAIAVAVDADPRLRDRVTVLVGATDGEDGSSRTSGGLVDAGVLRRAEAAGLDPARLLERCDSLKVLAAGRGTLPRRVTGTNVQDLRVILVRRSS